jgi:hypothetical protein
MASSSKLILPDKEELTDFSSSLVFALPSQDIDSFDISEIAKSIEEILIKYIEINLLNLLK